MREKIIITMLALILLLAGCQNPYKKYFTDIRHKYDTSNIIFTKKDKVEVIRGRYSDRELERLDILKRGYVNMGYSSFYYSYLNNEAELAAEFAEEIGAHAVYIASEYDSSYTTQIPIQSTQPTWNYINGQNVVTYHPVTTYMPITRHRYSYVAEYYWKNAGVTKLNPVYEAQRINVDEEIRKIKLANLSEKDKVELRQMVDESLNNILNNVGLPK